MPSSAISLGASDFAVVLVSDLAELLSLLFEPQAAVEPRAATTAKAAPYFLSSFLVRLRMFEQSLRWWSGLCRGRSPLCLLGVRTLHKSGLVIRDCFRVF